MTIMEIETKSVMDHVPAMSSPLNRANPAMLAAMRPERIGERLVYLRRALGLSSKEISDQLGIEQTYWSRAETGKRGLNYALSALLQERWDVTTDYLLYGKLAGMPRDLANRIAAIQNAERNISDAS